MKALEPVLLDLPGYIEHYQNVPDIPPATAQLTGVSGRLLDVSSGAVAFQLRRRNTNPAESTMVAMAAVGGVGDAKVAAADGYLHAAYQPARETFTPEGSANFAGGVGMSVHSGLLPDGTSTSVNAHGSGDWTWQEQYFVIARNNPQAALLTAEIYTYISARFPRQWFPPHRFRPVETSTPVFPTKLAQNAGEQVRGAPLTANVSGDTIWLYGGNAAPTTDDWPGYYGSENEDTGERLGNCWTEGDDPYEASIISIDRPADSVVYWVSSVDRKSDRRVYRRRLLWFRQHNWSPYSSSPDAYVEGGVIGQFEYDPSARTRNLTWTPFDPTDLATAIRLDGRLLDVADSGLLAVQAGTHPSHQAGIRFWVQTKQGNGFVPFGTFDQTLPVIPPTDGRPAPDITFGVYKNQNSHPHRCHLSKDKDGAYSAWLACHLSWGNDTVAAMVRQQSYPDGRGQIASRGLVQRTEWR